MSFNTRFLEEKLYVQKKLVKRFFSAKILAVNGINAGTGKTF